MTRLPEPSDREQEAITEAKVRTLARRPRLAVHTVQQRGQTVISGPSHSDQEGWCDRARDAFGTPSGDFFITELQRLGSALNISPEGAQQVYNCALAVLDGQRPANEIEAQLILQMAATHAAAMDFLGRTKRASTIENLDTCGRIASRLLARYTQQCDALTSLRRGGKQVVEVQHVYKKRRKPEGGKVNRGWFPKKPAPAAVPRA